MEPSSIKEAEPAVIVELMDKGILTPSESLQAFPNNEEIIAKAEKEPTIDPTDSDEKLIEQINEGKLNPFVATKNYPNHSVIVEAAYKKNPASIKNASIGTINKLGMADIIKMEDVLSVFSKIKPSPEELQKTAEQLNLAKDNKDWAAVIEICHSDKFWFERPPQMTMESLVQQLIVYGRWQDAYDLEAVAKEKDYEMIYGPLNKSPETYELEALFRKMMECGDFQVQTIDGEDYFVFTDETKFNWTKIRKKADLQHVDLQESDFQGYKKYMQGTNKEACDLLESREEHYVKQLYKGQAIPSPRINFQQMQAVNIYTGGFFQSMNGLMRDEIHKLNYRTANHSVIRSALVHSVMCGSALRMLPMTNIKKSYRGASMGKMDEHKKKVQAAANKEMVMLDGFVSTSTKPTAAFYEKAVFYTFKNLRGAYIAPISQHYHEQEFLIPPTQIQINSYKKKKWRHYFEATLASEVGSQNKDTATPVQGENVATPQELPQQAIPVNEANTLDIGGNTIDPSLLKKESPKKVMELMEKGIITPANAVEAFPDNEEIIKKAEAKASTLIINLEKQLVELITQGQLNPQQAVTANPNNIAVVEAAYKKNPSSIKNASREVINTLGAQGVIQVADVLQVFSISMPTEIDLNQTKQEHKFDATLVSEIGVQNKENIKSFVIPKETILNFANPEVVMALLEKDEILPARAVESFPEDKQIVLAAFNKDPDSIEYASPSLIENIEKAHVEKRSPKVEAYGLLESKLFKIKNFYAKEEKPNENFIRELSKAACKTPTIGLSHFSEQTKKAKYVIDRIASSKDLCEAFGVDYTKSKASKVDDLKKVLYKAYYDKPLFAENEKNQQKHP